MAKINDPQTFAEELNSTLHLVDGRFLDYAPKEREAFMDTLAGLKDTCPAEVLTALEERAEAWSDASHAAGIRLGVATEDFRKGVLRD